MAKRRVIIAHGWNDGGHNVWINWLMEELKRRNYEVIQPIFPHPHLPRPKEWVEELRQQAGELDANTVLVGYSLGVPTVLRYLNDYPHTVQIAGLILVAGFGEPFIGGRPAGLFDPPLNYERLRKRAAHRVCIYSDNDYLVAPKLSQQLALALEAREIIVVGGGHLIGLPVPGSVKQIPAVLEAVKHSYRLQRTRRGWRQIVYAVRKLWRRLR